MADRQLTRKRWLALGLALALGGACTGIAIASQIPPVYVTNGLHQPMLLRIDEQLFAINANDWEQLEGVSRHAELAEFSLDQGHSWSAMAVDLSIGPRAVVINPFGAAWVYTQGIVYSFSGTMKSHTPVPHCGQPLLRMSRADYIFEPIPPRIDLSARGGTLTKVLIDVDGSVDDCIATLTASGELDKAALLATLELDPDTQASVVRLESLQAVLLSETEYTAWLATSARELGGLTFKTLHQQNVLQGPQAQEYLLALQEQYRSDITAAETACLYSMTLAAPEALAVLEIASIANPELTTLNRLMALRYEEQGELELALPQIARLSDTPEFRTFAPYWSAQVYMRLGRVQQADAVLTEFAQSDFMTAAALARIRGELPIQIRKAWQNQGVSERLEIHAGGPEHAFADPFHRLNNLIRNGPTEVLFSTRHAQDLALVSSLGDNELMLLYALAVREKSTGAQRIAKQALDQRPVLIQALQDPYAATTNDLGETSFAVACLYQVWNGNLDPEMYEEMRGNVHYYDPFGMISEQAGWPHAHTDAKSIARD